MSKDLVDTFRPTPPDQSGRGADNAVPRPGLLLVFAAGEPCCKALPLDSDSIELGRGKHPDSVPTDNRMSRRHASVRYDGQCFHIKDLGSQNGTHVDGVLVGSSSNPAARVLRIAETQFLLCADLRPYMEVGVQVGEALIMGPALQDAHEQARRAARFGEVLHITGESGAGKEGLARTFHAASPRSGGPFVAVNCATIAEGLAERLLFGARRGAYSGAVADSEGLLQAARGGTLFLDEIAELSPAVQAKLLRVIESHEILPLGANRSVPVHLHLCSATHKDLRGEVSHGRFREDLYFRISRPKITLLPLRLRLEEIPWLVDRALKALDRRLEARTSLIEQCLLRHWPGNVRELIAELRTAGLAALAASKYSVERGYLCEEAGRSFDAARAALATTPTPFLASPSPPTVSRPSSGEVASPPSSSASVLLRMPPPLPETIEETLRREDGNISSTARALGLHRTQLKRLMERYGLTASRSGGGSE